MFMSFMSGVNAASCEFKPAKTRARCPLCGISLVDGVCPKCGYRKSAKKSGGR